MNTNLTGILWLGLCALALAKPGDLDRGFAPELRAWVAPDHVTLAADGRAWVGGGFERGDGNSAGDLLKLGENGGVAEEPAPGYLGKRSGFGFWRFGSGSELPDVDAPFLLAGGGFLLKGESGGWLRMNAAGKVVGKAFPDRLTGETITPQFERDGKLWVIRQLADGGRILERRKSADGALDPGFSQAGALPRNVNTAVPAPDGGAWVLAGGGIPLFYFSDSYGTPLPEQRVIQVTADGSPVGLPRVIAVPRTLVLVAGPADAFRLTYGADQSRWFYWPAPTSTSFRIEWYSAAGAFERTKDFSLPLYETFAWAEAADGSFVATDARTGIAGSSQYFIAKSASLRRYGPGGMEDPTFVSPGRVRSVKALAGGKWLIDGLRRLNADGSEDETWTAPQLDRPARVKTLSPLPAGRVLAGGDFATADGNVRNRLVVFQADGTVDPSFIVDERIGEWQSVAVSRDAIYLVTPEPVAVSGGFRSNLVKLRLDGTMDEAFKPQIGGTFFTGNPVLPGPGSGPHPVIFSPIVDNVSGVYALAGGDVLVVTRQTGDVFSERFHRLRPDGSQDPLFQRNSPSRSFNETLAIRNGGFVNGGVIYRADGSVEKNLDQPNIGLRPLCEWLGGVVFLETVNGPAGRLRLWLGNGWAAWFRLPTVVWRDGVLAAPGENGSLYVNAVFTGGKAELRRFHGFGWVDRSFRAPDFTTRERQSAGRWWKAEESGKVIFNPARHETISSPLVMLWHPESRRLWTGGNFNIVGGQPRDGLARVHGGFSRFR